jgi:hypothetical protein
MSDEELLVTRKRVFGPFNRCIYCGESFELSDEHVVPESLSGRWVLEKASCGKHRDKTSQIEGYIGRELLLPIRHADHFPSKNKGRPLTKLIQVKLIGSNEWTRIEVDIDDLPLLIMLPILQWPELMRGHTEPSPELQPRWWAMSDPVKQDKFFGKHSVKEFQGQSFDGNRVGQLLAKIAHCYAVARIGLNNFEPTLLGIIDGDLSLLPLYVGGTNKSFPPEEDDPEAMKLVGVIPSTLSKLWSADTLHNLDLQTRTIQNHEYIVVAIRLFSYLRAPGYLVIAGKTRTKTPQRGLWRLWRNLAVSNPAGRLWRPPAARKA